MTTDIEVPPMPELGTELVSAEAHALIAGDTPEQVLSNATQVANALKDLIERQGLATTVGRGKHVEVGGWQAAGAMLGALGGQPLHAQTIWSRRVDRDDEIVYEAHVEIRTLAGAVVGAAEALCSTEERNWRGSDEYAVKSMAETRAESRAYRRAIGWIIGIAGYSATPAEEMPSPGGTVLPAWAKPTADIGAVAHSLTELFQAAGAESPGKAAVDVGNAVFKDCGDTVPVCVARAVEHITAHLSSVVDATATEEPATAPATTTQEEAA